MQKDQCGIILTWRHKQQASSQQWEVVERSVEGAGLEDKGNYGLLRDNNSLGGAQGFGNAGRDGGTTL